MLYIVLKNIRQFFNEYRLIFILFVISQLVSTLSIMFVYSVVFFQQEQVATHNLANRTFSLHSGTGFDLSLDAKLDNLLTTYGSDIAKISFMVGVDLYAEYRFPNRNSLYVDHGRYFYEEDFSSGQKQIIVSDVITAGRVKVGDHYLLMGDPYEVIGVFRNHFYHEVPFRSIDSQDVAKLSITLSTVPNKKGVQEWTALLNSMFPDHMIEKPEIPNLFSAMQNLFRSLSAMAIGLLAFINFSYLYKYVLVMRKQQYATLRISGCNRYQGTVIYLAEVSVLSGMQYVLAAIIFHTAVAPLFASISANLQYLLRFGDYIRLYIIHLSVLCVVFLPLIIKYSYQMPVKLWRRDEL